MEQPSHHYYQFLKILVNCNKTFQTTQKQSEITHFTIQKKTYTRKTYTSEKDEVIKKKSGKQLPEVSLYVLM